MDENSTYVRKQTFFDGMKATPDPVKDIHAPACSRCSATP